MGFKHDHSYGTRRRIAVKMEGPTVMDIGSSEVTDDVEETATEGSATKRSLRSRR
jgi:hypothetical protein